MTCCFHFLFSSLVYYHLTIRLYTSVPGGKVNILGDHSIGHSEKKSLYEHVSYSEHNNTGTNLNHLYIRIVFFQPPFHRHHRPVTRDEGQGLNYMSERKFSLLRVDRATLCQHVTHRQISDMPSAQFPFIAK
jgi:hypothetical protein